MAGSPPRGLLIAVEAAHGSDAERGAVKVRDSLKRKGRHVSVGISRWDASGTFYELRLAGRKAVVLSPRTLLLLYASDLAFRLRWEIRPALAEGRLVIAAPYLETATAFGQAAGLSRKWMAELFRFAPAADRCLHVKPRKKVASRKRRSMDGFAEFAAAAVPHGVDGRKGAPSGPRIAEALQQLKRADRCDDLRTKTLGPLIRTLRDYTKPAPSKDR
jgi:thymidylate kinase